MGLLLDREGHIQDKGETHTGHTDTMRYREPQYTLIHRSHEVQGATVHTDTQEP